MSKGLRNKRKGEEGGPREVGRPVGVSINRGEHGDQPIEPDRNRALVTSESMASVVLLVRVLQGNRSNSVCVYACVCMCLLKRFIIRNQRPRSPKACSWQAGDPEKLMCKSKPKT